MRVTNHSSLRAKVSFDQVTVGRRREVNAISEKTEFSGIMKDSIPGISHEYLGALKARLIRNARLAILTLVCS